jgi:tRNA 2-selenouridine synthase
MNFIRKFLLNVRSEIEFLEDHIPSAVNLPVLTTAEWEEIGRIYKTDPFLAKKKGISSLFFCS